MKDICPGCRYDLSGLEKGPGRRCPECGENVESLLVSVKWTRELRRRWNLFYLSPLFALPGVVLVGIGQPVLAFGLGVMLGWRALELDNELFAGQSTRLGLVCNAVVLSMTWTLLTTFAILFVGWLLFYALS